MRYVKMKRLILTVVIITILINYIKAVDPYKILDLQYNSNQQKITNKYKKLMNSKINDQMKKIYTQAYKEIMLEETLDKTLDRKPKQYQKNYENLNQKEKYYEDKYHKKNKYKNIDQMSSNSQKTSHQKGNAIQTKDQQSKAQAGELNFNPANKQSMEAAQLIIFLLGILLKISPCICICLLLKLKNKQMRQQGPKGMKKR